MLHKLGGSREVVCTGIHTFSLVSLFQCKSYSAFCCYIFKLHSVGLLRYIMVLSLTIYQPVNVGRNYVRFCGKHVSEQTFTNEDAESNQQFFTHILAGNYC